MPEPFSRDVSAEQMREHFADWPTFTAQQIEVLEIAADWTKAVVRLGLSEANANFFGTAFGGSMFAMVDPFVVILAAQQLGPEYAVWDKSVEIDFVRPGIGPLTATVEMPRKLIKQIRKATENGEKLLRTFEIPILAENGTVVAVQKRVLYVRKTV